MKNIALIGGGTGTYVVLSGLKKYSYSLSAIVATTDSGGSTGRLRDQYGVLPPGDVRQCLVALSEAPDLWRKLFLYRFESGDFKGHNFGNIFLTALEHISPNYDEVVRMASYILQTRGNVVPVTYDKVHLCAEYEDGECIKSEDLIDTAFHKRSRIVRAYLEPEASMNPQVGYAIKQADCIIVGPGDIYTSVIPNLLVHGVSRLLQKSTAPIIYVSNLMTKPGQTAGYTALDHIRDLETYIGRKITYVVLNTSSKYQTAKGFYEKHGSQPVVDDIADDMGYACIRADVLSQQALKQKKADSIQRSVIRHDVDKLASVIHDIVEGI